MIAKGSVSQNSMKSFVFLRDNFLRSSKSSATQQTQRNLESGESTLYNVLGLFHASPTETGTLSSCYFNMTQNVDAPLSRFLRVTGVAEDCGLVAKSDPPPQFGFCCSGSSERLDFVAAAVCFTHANHAARYHELTLGNLCIRPVTALRRSEALTHCRTRHCCNSPLLVC